MTSPAHTHADVNTLSNGDDVVYQGKLKGKFVRYLFPHGSKVAHEAIIEFGAGTSSQVVPLTSLALPLEEVDYS